MAWRENTGQGLTRPLGLQLLDLPDDVLFAILSYCDLQSLGRLAVTCRRLAHLVRQDCVWLALLQWLTVVGDCRQNPDIDNTRCEVWSKYRATRKRDQCRIALSWRRGTFQDVRLVHHKVKQLPWLQFDKEFLWISYGHLIRCYLQCMDGSLVKLRKNTLQGHQADVTRFVHKRDHIVSGSRDGHLCCFDTAPGQPQNPQCIWHRSGCHTSDIHAVDFHDDVVVSGSRDATVKLWSMDAPATDPPLHTLLAMDRVWSVAMNPDGASFAVGTAGINHVPPLRLFDTESMELLGILGSRYRHGAGVLDIQYESADIVYSCGYDTFIRMWDLRTPFDTCALKWEEPFDMTIYSVKSDGNNAVLSGTARHGLVRLWDKRFSRPVQMYYTGRSSSPVYSLAFDSQHLYVALDRGINLVNFSH